MAESTQQAPWLPTTTLSGTEVLPVMSEGGRGVAVQTTTQAIANLAASQSAQFIVAAASSGLSAERVATDTSTVAWDFATATQAKASVPDASITTAKLAAAAIVAGPASTLFGSGTDGALASGAGTTTLTRDMFYTDGTLTTGDSIVTSGFEVRFSGTLTLATADTSAIRWTGTAGGAAAGATGGTGGAALASASLGGGTAGGNGGTGDADAGNAGTAGTTSTNAMGNTGGTGGDGGGGSPGAGGAGATITNTVRQSVVAPPLRGATLVNSGAGGGGGGSGEGNGGDGGGGGGGGAGGGMVRVYANVLATGSNVNPGVICSIGGVGGAGAAGVAGDANGGGGAGGGGGGHVMVVYGTRTGSAITNGIRATGGAGGNGGAGSGGGAVGFGGTGGTGGRIVVINVGANTCAETAGSAGSAGSGATGGAGGACQTNL